MELISRQAAIDAATSSTMEWDGMYVQDLNGRIREAIEQLPPIQPDNNSENPNSSDVISRQMAIDALENDKVALDKIIKGMSAIDAQLNHYVAQYNQVVYDIDAIKQLPPIQPELHWIPVTEDTPTEDDDYWCTFDAETGRFVDWCSWYHGRWVVWLGDIPNDVSNVIAWCKPMEPYKGVTE